MNVPVVSVNMPVLNMADVIGEAINSVMRQTLTDWELVIVDDGSTDGTQDVVKSFADERIRLLQNPDGPNRCRAANVALDASRGAYIARLDGDDIALPTKLETQVAYLETHPDIGVCGSWVQTFGATSDIWRLPTDPRRVHTELLFHVSVAHSSALFRRSVFGEDLRYDESILHGLEDWELWRHCVRRAVITNLPKVLVMYRVKHTRPAPEKWTELDEMIGRLLDDFGISYTDNDVDIHRRIGLTDYPAGSNLLGEAESWLERLIAHNEKTGAYRADVFEEVAAEFWFRTCLAHAGRGGGGLKRFMGSTLGSGFKRPHKVMRLAAKTIIKS